MGGSKETVAYFYDPDVGNFHYGKQLYIIHVDYFWYLLNSTSIDILCKFLS